MKPENRKKHIEEFKNMFMDIENAMEESLSKGLVSSGDYAELLNLLGTLYKYLYVGMEDMEEVDIMIEEKFTTFFEDMEQKSFKKGIDEGRSQGIDEGIKITYFIIRNPSLSDEEISNKTGNDLETIRRIRKSLVELTWYIRYINMPGQKYKLITK